MVERANKKGPMAGGQQLSSVQQGYNFSFDKSFGQHILKNPLVVQQIVEKSGIKSTDVILEIGPGTGNLTAALLERGKKIIAIEEASVFRNSVDAETPTINVLTMTGIGRDQCSIEGTADHRRLELKSGDKVVPCGRTIIVERYTDLVIHLLLKTARPKFDTFLCCW